MDSSTATQDAANRRKSGRSIRRPELFAEERYEGSLLSNGAMKRKRSTNGAVDEGLDEDEDQESSPEESEGDADDEERRERRRPTRSKTTGKPTPKKARKSNGVDATLAIRSANVQSKAPSKAAKVQQARSRKSQANEEGLYGTISLLHSLNMSPRLTLPQPRSSVEAEPETMQPQTGSEPTNATMCRPCASWSISF
jgi:hypothetical protein